MAMVLFYNRINWEDFPSVNTAINALRLNAMDYGLKTLDERTVTLDTTKAEKSVVLNTVRDWSLNEDTGIITITKVNGDVIKFDLNIEKIPVKFELSEDGILTMTTDDGTKFTANISSVIPIFAFESSDTIYFKSTNRKEISNDYYFDNPYTGILYVTTEKSNSARSVTVELTEFAEPGTMVPVITETYYSNGGVIEIPVSNVNHVKVTGFIELVEVLDENVNRTVHKAYIKDGSVKDKHLETNYLANIKTNAQNAELSANEAAESAEEAKGYAEQAKESAESFEFPVSIKNGGTGGTTAKEAQYNLLKDMNEVDGTIADYTQIAFKYGTPSESNGTLHYRKATNVWNYIKSKAEAIFAKKEDVALNRQTLGYTKKNLLKLLDGTFSEKGVDKVSNSSNGTVIFNGTATTYTYIVVTGNKYIKAGKYKLTGCPVGGKIDGIEYYRQTLVVVNANGSQANNIHDYGEGATFEFTHEMVASGMYVFLVTAVFANYTANNLTFRPMLRLADIVDDAFEPYVDDVDTRFKALTPVNNFLVTVPGSPLDAVMGKMLNDMISALEERFKWKSITVPEFVLDADGYTRTYEIDLSSYTEVEINLFIENYSQFSTYRCCLSGGGDYGYIYFLDEYTDQNGNSFGARLRVFRNRIEVYTLPSSANPTFNYIRVHGIMAR